MGTRGGTAQSAIERLLTEAVEHIRAGRLDQAASVLSSGGGQALRNPVGRNIMGDIRLKQGRPRDALREFDAALGMAASFPEAHCNRGVALQELGRLADALAAEDKALGYRPNYPMAHYNRGNILKELGRTDDAIAAYDRALKVQPAFPEALVNRGNAVLGAGKALSALTDFQKAIAMRPAYVEAHVGSADAHRRLNQLGEGLSSADRALEIEADERSALLVKTVILRDAERYDEALAVGDRLVARDAADFAGHTARAHALLKLKRLDEALAAADEAIRVAPKRHEGYTVRAMVLVDFGRFEEVERALATAERLGASSAEHHNTRAVALTEAGRLEEALAAYGRAIAGEPDFPMYWHNRSFVRLALGDFEQGWAEHEIRLKAPRFSRPDFLRLAPLWSGEELRGKRLLLYSEQGHGDTIQFVRYVPIIAERGPHISLVVHEALRRLFADNFPDIDVSSDLGMRTGFDYQAPLMSLAYMFGSTSESDIPRDVPYLLADDERVARWRERLGIEGFRVGIGWQGNPQYAGDRFRSIPLAAFAPLAAVPGVRLISLQSQQGLEQLDSLPAGMEVETLGEPIVNNPDGFREVAAVMANLDLLITSDSGPAHLAGAMGRPTWVALRDQPDWRWLVGRTDTPWYPTMRLFRQKTRGDWAPVFDEIAAALADMVTRRTPQ